jgi:hypothetical protein
MLKHFQNNIVVIEDFQPLSKNKEVVCYGNREIWGRNLAEKES